MRQKFKNRTLYTKRVVNNILSIYDQCERPTQWYHDANKFARNLSKLTGISTAKVCGVIAALSPLKSWDENKIIARMYLTGGPFKHTAAMKAKADAILAGSGEYQEICEILNGNKISAFFMNLYFPGEVDNVTIDRHALAVALGRTIEDNEAQITTKQYQFFERCYQIAAKKSNVTPMFMQSAVWERWRELKAEKKY